ncbi:Glycosyltransferase involved in cell wall bisynthesis [Thiothrix eikelboomii]|uniref:Glycosyltransferase involved in cell wall bisynthesis n=1 Tax=Thiothrix eikelboomii TaxID=92487 RepID=A0A1T4XIL8_9GAMM|nr:glycosyltransferase family 4 protein [Thiothrix eikelboomii]SKA89400.1 Glycosyltransferase involved in cell wall bisynthesis [Thiothrix eikelboomii]
MKKHFALVGALPESLINFRGSLIQSLCKANYQVTGMASETQPKVTQQLNTWGANFRAYPVQRNSLNPLADFKTWQSLRQTFQELQPDVILAYTIKPVIWGGLASRILPNTHFYALITGLGFAFQGETLKRKLLVKLVTFLYRIALKRAERVIFQNPDNLNEFIQRGIVPVTKCALVNGSGVDISRYTHTPLSNNPPVFLTIGRLLGEKGFREYTQAAQIVKACYPEVTFQLLGPEDPSSDGIPLSEVQQWHQSGWLEYLGSTDDVRPYLQNCHIYVLPSYYGEGLPRTIIEAMSIGRPILTTDNVGCRETVIPGENGYLVPKTNAQALAERMIWFIENRDQWERMGKRSRELAEEKYDVHKVNAQLMEIMGL